MLLVSKGRETAILRMVEPGQLSAATQAVFWLYI
jgi:hypothetical protein